LRKSISCSAMAFSWVMTIPPSPIPPRFLLGKKEKQPAVPMEPALLNSTFPFCTIGYSAPIACAASSTTGSWYCSANFIIAVMSAHWPYKCTGIIALIFRSVSAARSSAIFTGSMLKLTGSISAKTGIAPTLRMTPMVAKNE